MTQSFEEILNKASKLGIIDDVDTTDLDKIPLEELHELLCIRGLEIGYQDALNEFAEKGYLDSESVYKLRDTMFAYNLKQELKKKHYFKSDEDEQTEELF